MNNKRRKDLTTALKMISDSSDLLIKANEIIECCKDEEQDCYDNLPEGLQYGDKGDLMQEAIDNLDEAYDTLDEVFSSIDDACESIKQAIE